MISEIKGIYFLYSGAILQYVGSSFNVEKRIYQHWYDGKKFDNIEIYEVDGDLNTIRNIEGQFVSRLSPPLNRVSVYGFSWIHPKHLNECLKNRFVAEFQPIKLEKKPINQPVLSYSTEPIL